MNIFGLDFSVLRRPTDAEIIAAFLPMAFLLYVIVDAYNSIQKFALAGLIVVVWEFMIWQALTKKERTFSKKLTILLPMLTIFVACVGMSASYSLAKEKEALTNDPNHIASCSINPIVSCTNSITSSQGSALGISNLILGMAAYGLLLVFGIALLVGMQMDKKWWLLAFGGAVFGLAFCVYLFTQSLYVIGTLCLYCSSIWAVTSALFVYLTTYLMLHNYLPSSKKVKEWITKNHITPLLLIYGLIIILIYFRWSYYWNTLF